MITQTKRLLGGLSRLALMGSVALPSGAIMAAGGVGLIAAPVVLAQPAAAAVIIGNRNKLREKPRRNYKSTVRIDRDQFDASTRITVTGEVAFFAPDGTPGPVRELDLSPNAKSTLVPGDVTFYDPFTNADNILSVSLEEGVCDGLEATYEVPDDGSWVNFTLCETGAGAVTGKAKFTNAGKPRVVFNVPSNIEAKTELYGRILIKGEPLEMERTVYTGDVNDVEVGAVAGYTYEQTINVTDESGTLLDSQTVRGIVGGDEVDVMGSAQVIIGNRNKIKERPRRNYKSVSVTRDSFGGGATSGSSDIRVEADIKIVYTEASGQNTAPPIPPIQLTQPARANIAVTYANGPGAGDILSGGYCGGRFDVPVGGVDTDDGEIDDMSGTAIEGTDLKIRANPRLDGTLRVRIKGDYADFEGCSVEPLFIENGSGEVEDSFVNYIWEGEIDADPRTFDGVIYSRTTELTNESGKLLDRFTDLVALDPPSATTARANGYGIYGSRNRIREKPRRNYQGRTVSSDGGGEDTTIWAQIEITYQPANNQGEQSTVPTTTITTPLTSTYLFEVEGNGEGVVQPNPWCGFDIGAIALGEDTPLGDQGVTASMSERGNGNYRIKFKGPGEAFAEQCVGQRDFIVTGETAYDLGAQHVWSADIEGLPTDLPEDTVFDFTATVINADTGEELARSRQMLTANDAPREGPQISVVAFAEAEGFDRGVQAVFDGNIVVEGLPQDTPFEARLGPVASGPLLTTNVCHLFTTPEVTFADPDSVLDMKYLLEISTADETGEESGYVEYLLTGADNASESLGDQVSGDAFEVDAVLLQNDDMETYEVSVSLCGAPQIVSEAVAFIMPQDGGSDADPEDFILDFTDKIAILDVKVPARTSQDQFVFGTQIYTEARETSGDGGGRDPSDIRPIWVEIDSVEPPEGITAPIDVWACKDGALDESSDTKGICGTTGHLRPPEPTGQLGLDAISALVRSKGNGPKRIKGNVLPKPTAGAPINATGAPANN